MKTKDILITALCTAAAILSASCSSDELMNSDNGSPKAAIITASMPQTNVTRATGNVWKDYYETTRSFFEGRTIADLMATSSVDNYVI